MSANRRELLLAVAAAPLIACARSEPTKTADPASPTPPDELTLQVRAFSLAPGLGETTMFTPLLTPRSR